MNGNSANKKLARIVVIGGGTGVFTVLSGLRRYPLELSAVVTMADDGGSTGILREEFGILPPGDVRRALVALSYADNRMLADLFNYRFQEGSLKGHAFGNLMLTALERLCGNFGDAVSEAAKILAVRGKVLPVTLANVRLRAMLEDGTVVHGEENIDIPKHDPRLKIKRVFLEPQASLHPKAEQAISRADLIVIGPGDLYTSIMPNLVVGGMQKTLARAKGKKVYVVNVMTKWGETNGFSAGDFTRVIESELGKGVLDYVIINTKRPSASRFYRYEKESSEFVLPGDLPQQPVPVFGDFLRRQGFVRHDPEKLASILVSLL